MAKGEGGRGEPEMEEQRGTGGRELLEEEGKRGTQMYTRVSRYWFKRLILYILLRKRGGPDQYYINVILEILWQWQNFIKIIK